MALSKERRGDETDTKLKCEEVLSPQQFSSTLSSVGQIIRFDLWSCREADVSTALKRLADTCAVSKDDHAEQNCRDFLCGQGISVLVGVMSRWFKVPKIQALGCLVLHNVSTRKNGFTENVSLPLRETGALDTVLWAMLAYPTTLPVQLCACGFLSQALQVEENAIYVVKEMDGLTSIVKAQQRFPNNSGVQKWVHVCIEVLLTYRELRGVFLDTWVREAVNDAIKTNEGITGRGADDPSAKKRKY